MGPCGAGGRRNRSRVSKIGGLSCRCFVFRGHLFHLILRAASASLVLHTQFSAMSTSKESPMDTRSAMQAARLTEEQVGIQGYITTQPGFRGTLKYRYSDFIVHEVDLNKRIVRLTDTSPTAEVRVQQSSGDQSCSYSSEERLAALRELIGEAHAESVIELERAAKAGSNCDPVVLDPEADKKKRTAVHQFIKSHFLVLSTDSIKVGDAGQTAIRIFSSNNAGKSRGEWNERGNKRQKGDDAIYQGRRHPPPDMKFLKFVLLKENYDTMSAISTIARLLRVNPSTFAYAGTKVLRLSPLSSELLPLTALSSHCVGRTSGRAQCRL